MYKREDGQDSPSENSEDLMALASDSEEDGDYEKLLDANGNVRMIDDNMSQMSEDEVATPVKPRARRAK